MSIERNRLFSLVEFLQQSARLRRKPAASVNEHGLFALHEHQMQGLPGIRVNVNGAESEDEIWLAVKRLHEMKLPDITSTVLRPWLQMTQSPNEEPRLREATDGTNLIAAGTHCSSATPPEQGKPTIDPEATVTLSSLTTTTLNRSELSSPPTSRRDGGPGPRKRSFGARPSAFTLSSSR